MESLALEMFVLDGRLGDSIYVGESAPWHKIFELSEDVSSEFLREIVPYARDNKAAVALCVELINRKTLDSGVFFEVIKDAKSLKYLLKLLGNKIDDFVKELIIHWLNSRTSCELESESVYVRSVLKVIKPRPTSDSRSELYRSILGGKNEISFHSICRATPQWIADNVHLWPKSILQDEAIQKLIFNKIEQLDYVSPLGVYTLLKYSKNTWWYLLDIFTEKMPILEGDGVIVINPSKNRYGELTFTDVAALLTAFFCKKGGQHIWINNVGFCQLGNTLTSMETIISILNFNIKGGYRNTSFSIKNRKPSSLDDKMDWILFMGDFREADKTWADGYHSNCLLGWEFQGDISLLNIRGYSDNMFGIVGTGS